MPLDFDRHARVGKEFLKEIDMELNEDPYHERAGRILCSVLHALRDHLTLNENFQFMAQLPMSLKAIYVNGWSPGKKIKKAKSKEEFMEEVLKYEKNSAWKDFSSLKEVEESIKSVLGVLKRYVSEGEMKDIESVLPGTIKELVSDSRRYKKISL